MSQAREAEGMTSEREMRHRLKNQLAVFGALAKLLARHTESARDLSAKLENSLMALARAQDVLAAPRQGAIAGDVAVRELVQLSGVGDRVAIGEIPATLLSDETVQHVSLILAELVANARVHGALRDGEGRVELSGHSGDDVLTLVWREHCPFPVAADPPAKGGFQVVGRIGAARQEKPAISWHPDGVEVVFHVRTDTA